MPTVNPALKKEFAQLSKTANARIKSLKKGRYRSPAVEKLKSEGVKKFGVKAQKLKTEADYRRAIRQAKNFLGSKTSTRKGVKKVAKEMMKNFGIEKKGGESISEVTRKARKLFDLYDDLKEMANKGELQSSDKYDIIEMMNEMWEEGLITNDTSASEIIASLNGKITEKRNRNLSRQSELNFQWSV